MKITPIKIRRMTAGLQTDEAVEMLQISKSSFYKLEQGHQKPSAELIARIARVYQCTVDEIFKDFNIRG